MRRVLTDNRSCYRSRVFAVALGETISHKRTRPYLSATERAAAFPDFLHYYDHHCDHTAVKGASPASRVPNL